MLTLAAPPVANAPECPTSAMPVASAAHQRQLNDISSHADHLNSAACADITSTYQTPVCGTPPPSPTPDVVAPLHPPLSHADQQHQQHCWLTGHILHNTNPTGGGDRLDGPCRSLLVSPASLCSTRVPAAPFQSLPLSVTTAWR
jgi:hypothetical protein